MNKSLISNINCKILDFFEVSHNPLEIKKKLLNFETEKITVLNEFIDLLINSGSVSNLIFVKNTLTETEINQLLNELRFPIIVFQKTENRYIPTLITPNKKGDLEITGDLIGDNNSYNLKNKIALIEQLDKIENKDQFYVLSCFPNSTQFLEDDDNYEINQGEKNIDSVFYESSNKTFKRLLNLFASEKKDIANLYIYAAVVGLISLSLPLGIQSIIGFISSGQYSTSLIVLISLIIVGIVLNGGINIMQVWIVEVIQQRMFTKTAFEFAFRLPKLKKEALSKYYPPELVNRFFDIITLQKGFSKILTDLLGAFIQIIFGLILLAFYHHYFIAFGIIVITILIIILRVSGPKGLESSMYESKYKYQLVHWLQEIGRSVNSFKMAGFTNLPIDKTDYIVSNYLKSRNKHFKILVKQYIAFVAFKTIITAGLLSLGCILVINKEINLGQFVAAEIIIILLMNAVEKIIKNLDTVYDVLTSLEKIGTILDLPIEVNNGINPNKIIKPNEGFNIKIKSLNYSFPGGKKNVLSDINLDLHANDVISISGFKDAGKSTLINAIIGNLSGFEGSISMNGISINNFNKTALYHQLGSTFNEDLFDGTLLENITMGNSKIDVSDILYVLEFLKLNDYVISLPDGLNTQLVGGNIHASKSTVSKLLLARAILKRPKLLIINDVGFYRDGEKTEIYKNIIQRYNECTILFISNKPEVIKLCKNNIIMKEGKVVLHTNYEETIKSEHYKNLTA